jgi:hypothetical protein
MQLDYWVMTLTEHETGTDTAHATKNKSMYEILIRKHEAKRPSGMPRDRCDDN